MVDFQISRQKGRIAELKAKEAVLAAVNGSGQKRRVVEMLVTVELEVNAAIVKACRDIAPQLDEQMKVIASHVEDGGGGLVVQAKTKLPPMTLDLHPEAPKSAPTVFHWTVAESKSPPTFRIDRKGNGLVRFRWKVRATKGDLDKIPDWLSADVLISAAQTQVTVEELERRKTEEGKAPKADPFKRAKGPKGKGGKKAKQGDLPLSDEEGEDADADDEGTLGEIVDAMAEPTPADASRALPAIGETTGADPAPTGGEVQ